MDDSFADRVLDYSEAGTVVVDEAGDVLYVSRAASELGGLSAEDILGHNLIEFVHPDDVAFTVEAFVGAKEHNQLHRDQPASWPPLHLRLVGRHGETVNCQVIGHGALEDPVVKGIVYTLLPSDERVLVQTILHGISAGADRDEVFRPLAALVGIAPPVLDVAILRAGGTDTEYVTATGVADQMPLTDAIDLLPDASTSPGAATVADIGAPLGPALAEAGYIDCWVASVPEPGDVGTYLLVCLTREPTLPGASVRQRLEQAVDLTRVALQRWSHERQLAHAALHDHLTGLANRAQFHGALERRHPPGTGRGVLFVDLDGFKALNDAHGHQVGDVVLREVGRRLADSVRPGDLAARLGGDEFAVLCEGLHSTNDAEMLAARLVDVVAQPMELPFGEVLVGASIGVAVANDPVAPDSLLAAADQAMYDAKRAGKGVFKLTLVATPPNE